MDEEEENIELLFTAARKNDLDGITSLLDHTGLDIDECDNDCWTALHCAAKAGHVEACELLIHRQADVNSRNIVDDTPLHVCIFTKHISPNTYINTMFYLSY